MTTTEIDDMKTKQLELAFDGSARFAVTVRRADRLERARWWFAQMHKAVRRAWQAPPPPRPMQATLGLHRVVAAP